MARSATLAVAALIGLLLAGCTGGSFGQAGLSLPAATSDGVQTVSDAADALDGHRTSGSANAKAAIAVTDALGSFVREISADQEALARAGARLTGFPTIHSVREYTVEVNGRRVAAGSELLARPALGQYCQSSAGYTVSGIPSLDETFGWQSGTAGGTRTTDTRGGATWSANASGAIVQGEIGTLSVVRRGTSAACSTSPAFVLKGGTAANAFSLPLSMAFHRGELINLSVVNGKFASGDSLEVTTQPNGRHTAIRGAVANGGSQLATFRTNVSGDGTLTITSTGAQYVIANWIVVGT
jgi:hypothetical protein